MSTQPQRVRVQINKESYKTVGFSYKTLLFSGKNTTTGTERQKIGKK
jgi:hypothetical protein